jgi:hypothetical protein
MTAPSPRNPIRPARGNKIDLTTNIANLYEGEICYAIDEDRLYVVENAVLVPVGSGSAAGSSLLSTNIINAQLGESLNYNGVHWVNGGIQDGGSF